MSTLNLGILAHVDAGKTTLTERLLYAVGVIDEIGSVDQGSTQTDSLPLERRRGITIKSAVVSFDVGGTTVNLIDTPGHPDFIAEVERVLSVLDGAVLVISAVEGVQSQTRVLMRTLQRLHIPTLIFVNKIDRGGADDQRVLQSISERLTPAIIPMGSVHELGSSSAGFTLYGPGTVPIAAGLADVLADHNDEFLAAYVDDAGSVSYGQFRDELAAQTAQSLVHPVFFGSAITGAGADALIAGITELLPANSDDIEGEATGSVFKVERGRAGEKIAYVRMFSGTVSVRDQVRFRSDREGKVTAIKVFERGSAVQRQSVVAGEIAQLWGLADIQIGDTLGRPRAAHSEQHQFAPPTLETVVLPRCPADRGALHAALSQLAEQDPLINLRQDDLRQEISASLYGEVQKEVIESTLSEDYGIEVDFRETTTICIERPIGTGTAVETLPGGRSSNHPFLAGVGLRVDPAPVDSGVEFQYEIELGSLPPAFFKAIEETVAVTLQQGIHGWQVTDCSVTLTYSAYAARQSHSHAVFDKGMSSTAGDFRELTPLVLMSALKQAGTEVFEPIHRFELDVPADTVGAMMPVLAQLYAVPRSQTLHGWSATLEGEIPVARVHALQQQLPALTRGEGVLESAFDRYQPVRGSVPSRPRTDHDPLNRREYLLHVVRRV